MVTAVARFPVTRGLLRYDRQRFRVSAYTDSRTNTDVRANDGGGRVYVAPRERRRRSHSLGGGLFGKNCATRVRMRKHRDHGLAGGRPIVTGYARFSRFRNTIVLTYIDKDFLF